MLGFVAMTPLYFVGFIVNAPNGALAVALTIFPLTSPTFSLIRMTLTNVPTWQLVAGAGTIVFCLLGGIWVVARVFRAAMLLYGQRLSGAEVWQAIRQAG
jgi:ABC-2 type transport system permease protein